MNARGVALGSVLFLGVYVAWASARSLGAPLEPATYKRIWQTGALALAISVATDVAPQLGATLGAAIVLGFVVKRTASGQPILTPAPRQTALAAGPGSPLVPSTSPKRSAPSASVPPDWRSHVSVN